MHNDLNTHIHIHQSRSTCYQAFSSVYICSGVLQQYCARSSSMAVVNSLLCCVYIAAHMVLFNAI
jgi:hypothetical protein